MRKVYLTFLIFFLLLVNTIQARAKIQVYSGGFSFCSILPNETITNSLLKDNGGIEYLDQLLLKKLKNLSNESFQLKYSLLRDNIGEENQNILVLALDGEYIDSTSIKSENLTRTDIILNFQIIFFNAKTNFLVASIPLEISKNISSKDKLSKDQIKQELKMMYENEVVKYYFDLLENFNLQSKYKNRIGVTNVIFEDNAKEYFKKNMNKEDIFLKNRFAKSLSSFIAFNNNVAIVPYSQDR